jgi:hypothetical protein
MLANHDIGTVIFEFYFTYLTIYYIFLMILYKTTYLGGFPFSFIFFMYFYAIYFF